jgi:hypothetical protein
VLRYAHADIVGSACIRLQVTRGHVGASGLIEDGAARRAMASALATLVDHAIDAAEDHADVT